MPTDPFTVLLALFSVASIAYLVCWIFRIEDQFEAIEAKIDELHESIVAEREGGK
jgi:hypothetical protein